MPPTLKGICLLALLLLAGCSEEYNAVTPMAWKGAEERCAWNSGVKYIFTESYGGVRKYKVTVVCKNEMRTDFEIPGLR